MRFLRFLKSLFKKTKRPEHKHLIVRAEVKNPFRKGDENKTSEWLSSLVKKIGMKVISGPHVAFATAEGNTGITACVLIETSHCSLHIWDSDNPPLLQLDVYSCSSFRVNDVFEHMLVFKPTRIEYKFLDREKELRIVG